MENGDSLFVWNWGVYGQTTILLRVCEMEVKKVAVLLCQEWHTSPCWSLKALEELLLIGELICPDSLLPPLF